MAGVADIMRNYGVLARLVAINCMVFFFMAILSIIAKTGGQLPFSPINDLALSASFNTWLHHPWTIVTYMFTHENFLHILFNMLWLLWFGRMFMECSTSRALTLLYIGGGIGGGVLYMLLYQLLPGFYGFAPVLMGASASVMAIMAATAVLMPNYPLHLFFIGDVKLKWIAVTMIALAFLGLGGGNAAGGIAHVGGVLTGLIVGVTLKRQPAQRQRTVKRKNPFKHIDKSELAKAQRPGVHDAAARERADAQRLDELLDKIHTSGFNSLTLSERKELQTLSQKVTK